MKTIVVRYKTKRERADENQRLVEDVYTALAALAPAGFEYATFRLEDGVSFVHIARESESGTPGFALNEVPGFKAFLENIAERCVEPPDAKGAAVVGSYNFFAS